MPQRKYKGSLKLDWINKDLSLYYEIDEKEGRGVRPVWVPKNDIRVAEPRVLRFIKNYGDIASENMLIKGDNLLVLRSLVEMFKGRPDREKVKCIYIDPPYNTGQAFEKYDDNLKHSEWLSMMRDRLFLLRKLMREDAAIFVQIDYEEQAYLKVLMDEIFGRNNFIQLISVKTAAPAGFKTVNPGPIDVTEYILFYTKNRKKFRFKKVYVASSYDKNYRFFIENREADYSKWKVVDIADAALMKLGIKAGKESKKELKQKFGSGYKDVLASLIAEIALEKADSVFRVTDPQGASGKTKEYIEKSKENRDQILELKRDGYETAYFWKGGLIAFYSRKVKKINNQFVPTTLLTDLWNDIAWEGIQNEGGVILKKGKKPEALIERIIELACDEDGEIVFDCFAGSGTTGAVAHKMKKRWIMAEMGEQAETHIIPRLQSVVDGRDQSGITKNSGWSGGGGFKYYQLGESLIHEQGMNWSLKAQEMAEAVFLHFQYRPVKSEWLEKESMYLGRHQSTQYHFALSFASREAKTLTDDLYEKIIAEMEKEKFKHLTIFTNVAVSVPPELLGDRVFIKKIPAAILREYNLL